MPHVVELSLAPEDFRLHPGLHAQGGHWLVSHPYGFGLLVAKLGMERPDLGASQYRRQPELAPYLEEMVDALELREWPEPLTVRERARVVVLLLRMAWCLKWGSALPAWRPAGADSPVV